MARPTATLVLGIVVAGCAAAGASPPESPTTTDQPSLSVPGSFEPYVFGHERLMGQVIILGVPAAEASAIVEGGCTDGATPMTIRSSARATGLFALLARSRIEMNTTLLPSLDLPRTGHTEVDLGERRRTYSVDYDQSLYRYQYTRSDGPTLQEVVPLPGATRAHDLHSAVLLLRSWRPLPGTRAEFLTVLGRRLWQVELVYQGPDVAVIGDSPRPAVLIEGLSRRLARNPASRTERKFRVWFSDDAERVPLRAVADSEFGNVEIEATSYACPGCAHPCRGQSGAAPSSAAGSPRGPTDGGQPTL